VLLSTSNLIMPYTDKIQNPKLETTHTQTNLGPKEIMFRYIFKGISNTYSNAIKARNHYVNYKLYIVKNIF